MKNYELLALDIDLDLTRPGLDIRNDLMRTSRFISMTTAIAITILGDLFN